MSLVNLRFGETNYGSYIKFNNAVLDEFSNLNARDHFMDRYLLGPPRNEFESNGVELIGAYEFEV